MTVSAADFRDAFPEFSDLASYTDRAVNMWLSDAAATLPVARLGARADLAMMLYVGHNLALSAIDQRAAIGGGAPGMSASGVVSSKSVGPASVSYDTGAVTYDGAGQYNSTSYGRRLWAIISSVATFTYIEGNPRFR